MLILHIKLLYIKEEKNEWFFDLVESHTNVGLIPDKVTAFVGAYNHTFTTDSQAELSLVIYAVVQLIQRGVSESEIMDAVNIYIEENKWKIL